MGCCQSSTAPEPELLPKARPKVGAADMSGTGAFSGTHDEEIDTHSDIGDGAEEHEEGEEADKSIEYHLDRIVGNGCKYFLCDMPNADLAVPDDEYDDETGDWSIAFNPKMVPGGGLPQPSRELFGAVPDVIEPTAALSLLQSCRPAPYRQHRMIEICSQLISSVNATSVMKTTRLDGSELKVAADVNIDQLLSENSAATE